MTKRTSLLIAVNKNTTMMSSRIVVAFILLIALYGASNSHVSSLSFQSSGFHGQRLSQLSAEPMHVSFGGSGARCELTMRKQKASDRRTRRRQRGDILDDENFVVPNTLTRSPMEVAGAWNLKKSRNAFPMGPPSVTGGGGRGRSRKRSTLYNSLAYYHNHFLNLLTNEYQAEEEEVLGRIKASVEDGNPLGLETAGFALYDMYPQRRGNLFSDEVYRLTKAQDATNTYKRSVEDDEDDVSDFDDQAKKKTKSDARYLPPNHKFSNNDVIMITLQPNGSGDFFGPSSLPTSDDAVTVEARVLSTGPTYIDVALQAGSFERTFGPAPNDYSGNGDKSMRVRVDRFVSNVPYQRMVAAVAQLTTIPDTRAAAASNDLSKSNNATNINPLDMIKMDEVIRETILSTHACTDPYSPLLGDPDVCDVEDLSNKLSKPPMGTSHKLASQVLKYIKANPEYFREFNPPQLAAIEAALTRRMTMIQGPPGSGKTTVAAAIGFGFVHQCRTISEHTKVLACAFSNVGADNLAEALLRLGLKVVRVGKPSAVTESLWDHTLEAAIHRDPDAQKALEYAARATAELGKINKRGRGKSASSTLSDQSVRDAATAAVKASVEACNIAATKCLRQADVIVSTSTGAADARLLAACGIVTKDTEEKNANRRFNAKEQATPLRELAPDGLPPLSLPFVMVDEACQSVEPATLVPVVSSNSCRSLVMLGDPCQLPPTVRSRASSPLSVSLMERLSSTLPAPSVSTRVDNVAHDNTYLNSLPIKQAKSLIRSMDQDGSQQSYRKRFRGSLLLSVQYRMHPSISAFASSIFYDGQLVTPAFMAQQRTFPKSLSQMMPCGNPDMSVRAIDVGGRGNERQGNPSRYSRTAFSANPTAMSLEDQTTYWNELEAGRVISLIKDMLRGQEDTIGAAGDAINSIGVISPYNGQVQLIKSIIATDAELRELLLKLPVTIEVKSVDGYQGRERDVIIFSAVRSNRQGNIGFLRDWRRMNVALTRAKSALLVVGDFATLSESDKHWAAFSKWASGARCVVDDFDSPEDEPSL